MSKMRGKLAGEKFEIGDRVRLNEKLYGYRKSERLGTVMCHSKHPNVAWVCWDGLKASSIADFHQDFLDLVKDNPSPGTDIQRAEPLIQSGVEEGREAINPDDSAHGRGADEPQGQDSA